VKDQENSCQDCQPPYPDSKSVLCKYESGILITQLWRSAIWLTNPEGHLSSVNGFIDTKSSGNSSDLNEWVYYNQMPAPTTPQRFIDHPPPRSFQVNGGERLEIDHAHLLQISYHLTAYSSHFTVFSVAGILWALHLFGSYFTFIQCCSVTCEGTGVRFTSPTL
jgi:hypothetical protein